MMRKRSVMRRIMRSRSTKRTPCLVWELGGLTTGTPLMVSQEELRAEQERFDQHIDNFQAEQTRQYDLLHQIQDDQRWSFEWLFALTSQQQYFISLTSLSLHGSIMDILLVVRRSVLEEVRMGKQAVLVRMMTRRTSLMFSLPNSLACFW
ncbi:hypothetical protein E3N88_12134 [Mikania micrantha]|uniref:Uncharacterized protein n=1 Tax=Mikania micrantha TaxID=192012 RepID=A0A5N6P7L9_9ASTR|nr:hypothetical protein E3N88_12134 [Mikania micrantha]